MMKKLFLVFMLSPFFLVFMLLPLSLGTIFAKSDIDLYFNQDGKAIKGYDPVAYFDGKPQMGSEEFVYRWKGTDWHFTSKVNLDKFRKSPEKYAPQYGGYCAWAVSRGYTASTDPEAWTVHKNKLYLNYSKSVQKKWSRDIPGNVKRANQNWPELRPQK